MLPSRLNLTKGKRSVLMNLVSQNIGENMIACVDADYDYLLQGTTPLSDEVINTRTFFIRMLMLLKTYNATHRAYMM